MEWLFRKKILWFIYSIFWEIFEIFELDSIELHDIDIVDIVSGPDKSGIFIKKSEAEKYFNSLDK